MYRGGGPGLCIGGRPGAVYRGEAWVCVEGGGLGLCIGGKPRAVYRGEARGCV